MGIQTTRQITREEAEKFLVERELKKEQRRREILNGVVKMSDEQLENALDEEFYNYSICK